MFDNKDKNEDYSSDELELMKMIKEYERDEAIEKDTQDIPAEDSLERMRDDSTPTYQRDSALGSDANHTRVMSHQGLDDDKTLSIMPVGNQGNDTQYERTQNIPTQPQPVEEDDPRFELKRNKDKKTSPKKNNKKNKKDKKPTSEDERLNKIILILMIVAGIVVVSCGGYLIYNSFFRDTGSNDEKTEEVTTPKKNTTKTDKKNNTTTTTPKEETTTPEENHSAEITALQKLIDTETTNANNATKAAAEARTKAGAYESNRASLEEKVAAAQKVLDDAEEDGETATEEQLKALSDAQKELTDLETNIAAQEKIAEENDAKASISFAKIEDYRKQIAAYQ